MNYVSEQIMSQSSSPPLTDDDRHPNRQLLSRPVKTKPCHTRTTHKEGKKQRIAKARGGDGTMEKDEKTKAGGLNKQEEDTRPVPTPALGKTFSPL